MDLQVLFFLTGQIRPGRVIADARSAMATATASRFTFSGLQIGGLGEGKVSDSNDKSTHGEPLWLTVRSPLRLVLHVVG